MNNFWHTYWHFESKWFKSMAYRWKVNWPRPCRFYAMVRVWKIKITFSVER